MYADNNPLNDITITFLSGTDGYTYTPMRIESMYLAQDFIYGYGDQLKATLHVSMADYAELYKRYKNLVVQVIIREVDRTGVKAKTTPMVKKFYPVFDNFKDPNKMMTDVKYRTEPAGNTITVTLVEATLYHIRHMPVQGIFHDTDMAGIMAHIANMYQITDAYIQLPDNAHVYQQIVIPPYKEFKDVFHTLQERYGVYMLGLNNYFTEEKLYIWPIFDTTPKSTYYVKIFQADDGAYAGSSTFHRTETNGLSIVINNSPNAQDRSLMSAESKGTSVQFLRSAAQVDGIVTQDENGLLTYNEDNVITVGLNSDRLARDDANHSTYVHQTDNLFAIASELKRDHYVSMALIWPQAKPWLIKPGTAVRYYSDEDGKIGLRTGLVDKVLYEYKAGDRGSVLTYTCKATLLVRLDPTEQIVSSIT